MQDLAGYLQGAITDKMPLEEMVGVFERMCRIPAEEDRILFETGTVSLNKKRRGVHAPALYFEKKRPARKSSSPP